MIEKNKSIIVYKEQNRNLTIEVKVDNETIWMTQKQIAELFETERSVITKHINNIFKTEELNKNSVCAKFAHTASYYKQYKS
ncbi:MAG: hypothetical protein HZB41_08700 [Ignavibacteriae bacterium]|nr:hypothetical protein [Ignavibacteriota bacterium]